MPVVNHIPVYMTVTNVDEVGDLGANEDFTDYVKNIALDIPMLEEKSIETGEVANQRILGRLLDPEPVKIQWVANIAGMDRHNVRYEFSFVRKLGSNANPATGDNANTTVTYVVECVCLGPASEEFVHKSGETIVEVSYSLKVVTKTYAGSSNKEVEFNWDTGVFQRDGQDIRVA